MIWNVIGLACAVLSAVAAVVWRKTVKRKRNGFVTPLRILLAGVFLAVLFMMIPLHEGEGLTSLLLAVHATFQVFTVDADNALIGTVGSPFFAGVLSVLYVAAPVLTFGFVVSFFKNVSARFRFFLKKGKDLYVFSELNEKSLVLAEDIRLHHKDGTIVFTDVFDKGGEESYENLGRAAALDAICLHEDILALRLKRKKNGKRLDLFAIGEDEAENIRQALALIDRYGDVDGSNLYVFALNAESELLLSHNKGLKMKVRRMNEVSARINRFLFEHGTELFAGALPSENGEKKIHAVIAGLGVCGKEMLKALTWYCQMDGYRIEIDAFDRDLLAEDKLKALCPELLSESYNGVTVPGEAAYTIRIHSGIDVTTKTFADKIAAMKDVTFAFAALGSDRENVSAAVTLRMLFERSHIKPALYTVVFDPNETQALSGVRNYRGQAYDICCIGDLKSTYSEAGILHTAWDDLALQRHLKWGNEEDFWQYEYNYRSSVASAIHLRARIFCGIPGADKTADALTKEEAAAIETIEHRRWNAYMRSEGYVFSGSTDKSSRNDLGKMHHDLVDFSRLTEEEKRKDRRVGTVG